MSTGRDGRGPGRATKCGHWQGRWNLAIQEFLDSNFFLKVKVGERSTYMLRTQSAPHLTRHSRMDESRLLAKVPGHPRSYQARKLYRHGSDRIEVMHLLTKRSTTRLRSTQRPGMPCETIPKRLIAAARDGGSGAARGIRWPSPTLIFACTRTFNYMDAGHASTSGYIGGA